jgi:hypothetical protein
MGGVRHPNQHMTAAPSIAKCSCARTAFTLRPARVVDEDAANRLSTEMGVLHEHVVARFTSPVRSARQTCIGNE